MNKKKTGGQASEGKVKEGDDNARQFSRGSPANTLRKSSIILRLYFGNLRKLLSANVVGT